MVGRLLTLLCRRWRLTDERPRCAHEVLVIGADGAAGGDAQNRAVMPMHCPACGTVFVGREAQRRLAAMGAGRVRGGCVQ